MQKLTKQQFAILSTNKTLLITVIVAVYNARKTIQHCIDSVAHQGYPLKELIIIDGGSTDGTVELLDANKEKISYCISEPDQGIYNAWNKGLAHAQGEWICFLGADDYLWDTTVFERIAAHLEMFPKSVRVVYGQIMLVGNGGELSCPIGDSWPQIKERFKEEMCIPHVGTMHRRSLFDKHGNFDESFRIAGDYELLLRELVTGDAVFIPDLIIAGQRLGGISTDIENSLLIRREVRRAQCMHGQKFSKIFLLKEEVKIYLWTLWWKMFGRRKR